MNPISNNNYPSMKAGLFVWTFGAAFYLLAFFHRVAPAVITGELMQDFQINAAALGNLSAFYFYSYATMQIPTGIIADKWGPRRLITLGAMTAAIGAVIFALAPNIVWAAAGRLLIGGSVAVAFVCLLKLTANWFAPNRFAMLSGLALFCGIVGAVFAGPPLRFLVDDFGWRNVILFTAVITLLVGTCAWLFIRDFPQEKGFNNFIDPPSTAPNTHKNGVIADLLQVFTFRNTLLLFLVPGGIVGSVLTFSGLWGVPFLTSVYGVSPATAATYSSALLVAWALGGPFFGWVSDRLKNRKTVYLIGAGIATAGWMVIVLFNNLSLSILVFMLIITGFSSGCIVISFAFAKESMPIPLAGTVSGVINMGVMIGPMFLQPAVGWMLDRMWEGDFHAGVRIYTAVAYKNGFSLMLIWLALSLLLLFFTRETGCKQLIEK